MLQTKYKDQCQPELTDIDISRDITPRSPMNAVKLEARSNRSIRINAPTPIRISANARRSRTKGLDSDLNRERIDFAYRNYTNY